ncbi:MAG: rhomboid family intramembrane serine protease, partial [Acidimicrobiia bacterium]
MTEAEREAPAEDDWRCYRHPDRAAGVRCRRCERPICPDCMVTAPVGFQCPSCVKGAPAVRTMRSLQAASRPIVSSVLVAVNLALFVPTLGDNRLIGDLGLFGPAVAAGEWWRLVTSGFMHVNLVHVGFNCLLLWQLGGLLEPALGRVRFALLYTVALLAGAVGVLLLDPLALTAGASGAVFGLMGAAVIGLRQRGINPMQSGLGGLLIVNLVLTFAVPGISIGGHL